MPEYTLQQYKPLHTSRHRSSLYVLPCRKELQRHWASGYSIPMKSASIWKSMSSACGLFFNACGFDTVKNIVSAHWFACQSLYSPRRKHLHRCRKRFLNRVLQSLPKSQIHVNIIVESGIFNESIVDVIVIPWNRLAVGIRPPLCLNSVGPP